MSVTAATTLSPEAAALVERHVGLATSIARGWARRCRGGIEPADLQQAACVGLIEAARRYDPSRDSGFAAFASVRVRGAICDYLRAHDPLTRGRRHAVRELDQAQRALASELGRVPHADEVAVRLGWDASRVEVVREDAGALEAGWAQVQDATPERVDVLESGAPSPFDVAAARQAREQLVHLLGELSERERMVISLHYFEEIPFKDIAAILGVTDSRVSQIHSAALARLRQHDHARELALVS